MAKPKIRFNGYTEDWEQRKVGELLEERNEQAPMSEDYPLMAFIANQGVAPKGERYDRSALVNDETGKKYKRTEFGDFIYSSNNLETGSIGLNKYGNACISPVYSIFKPTGKAELDFLGRRFLRKDFINEMVRWRQGVVYGQWKIHETDFMKIEVRIPSVDEQKKIGQYFDSLDNLITLHQRKCEQTKTLKKYMLQKMFPQDGEKVPQIRFEGFTEDWEQRKVLDLLIQPITDGPHETPKLVEEGVPFISVDAIVDNKIDFNRKRGNISEEYDELCCKKYKPQFHDVYLVKSGSTVGKVAIVETTDRFNIWSPLAAMRCGEKTYPYFLYDLLQTKDLQAQVADKASNGTQPNLSMRELEKFPVSVPSNLEEQKKIGDYFRNLDHLITLHQRKCDELKEVKKFMLQNMFV